MKKSKLRIILTSSILVCLLGMMLVPHAGSAQLSEADKFKLKKDILAAFVDLSVKYYEKIQTSVTKNEKLKEEEKKDLLEVIDPGIVIFSDQRDKMSAAKTDEELEKLTEETKERWGDVQTELKQVEGDILYYRIDKLRAKAEIISGTGKAVSTTFQTLGTDTAKLDDMIVNFDKKIEEAASEARLGVDIYKTIIRLGDLIKAADALDHFANAYKTLEEAEKLAQDFQAEMERLVAEQK